MGRRRRKGVGEGGGIVFGNDCNNSVFFGALFLGYLGSAGYGSIADRSGCVDDMHPARRWKEKIFVL